MDLWTGLEMFVDSISNLNTKDANVKRKLTNLAGGVEEDVSDEKKQLS